MYINKNLMYILVDEEKLSSNCIGESYLIVQVKKDGTYRTCDCLERADSDALPASDMENVSTMWRRPLAA